MILLGFQKTQYNMGMHLFPTRSLRFETPDNISHIHVRLPGHVLEPSAEGEIHQSDLTAKVSLPVSQVFMYMYPLKINMSPENLII